MSTKVCLVKVMFFSSSHVWMWELDHKDSWTLKNWCFWTVVLKKTVESPLDCKIKSVNPKGNQSWICIGRTDAKAEAPIFLPPDMNNWLIGKDLEAEKDWKREEKGMTGWNGWMASLSWWTWVWASSRSWWWTGKLSMLACCSPWGCKELDTTKWLNWSSSSHLCHSERCNSPSRNLCGILLPQIGPYKLMYQMITYLRGSPTNFIIIVTFL